MQHLKKVYYAELSDDKTIADVYAVGGSIKASFRVDVVDGRVLLYEDINHAMTVIPTPFKAISNSPFIYDEEEKKLSVFITMVNNETITLTSTLSELVERGFQKEEHCHKKPFVEEFATLFDLKEEAKRRKYNDDKILSMIGEISDGRNSLSSQILALETALASEISRSKKRDMTHSENIGKLSVRVDSFEHRINDEMNETSKLVKKESDERIAGLNEVYSIIEKLKEEDVNLFKRIERVADELRREIKRAEDEERHLHHEIHHEHEERLKEEKKLYDLFRMMETGIRNGDDKLHHEIHHEYNRAKREEDGLLCAIKTEVKERMAADEEMNKRLKDYIDLKFAELNQNLCDLQKLVNEKMG